MLTRDEMFKKYFESDIFNNKPPIKTSRSCKKIRVNHPTFERTNLDIFNIDKKAHIQRNREKRKIIPNSKSANRLKVYSKLYGSDIFNRVPCANTERPKKGGIMRAAAKNKSHCMDGVKDNNEYIKVIKKYETEHRAPEEDFKPYRYLKYEAPAERYYKNYYDLHGMVVLPESKDNKTNRADYAHNRRYLNKEKNKTNENKINVKYNFSLLDINSNLKSGISLQEGDIEFGDNSLISENFPFCDETNMDKFNK